MSYSNAFNCAACPENNGEAGCPNWHEMVMQNSSGEQKIIKDCGYVLMPVLMVEVIKASNRPAAAVEEIRNDLLNTLTKGFSQIVQVNRLIAQLKDGEVK